MYWFIAAFLVASTIFKFAPNSRQEPAEGKACQDAFHPALLLLPLLILGWLAFTLITAGIHSYDMAAIGFVLTACSLAAPSLRRFLIPCAAITGVSIVFGVLQAMPNA